MVKTKNRVVVRIDYCKGCELCIAYCKRGVLRSAEELNKQGYHYARSEEHTSELQSH